VNQLFTIRTRAIREEAMKAVMAIRETPLMDVVIRPHRKVRTVEQNSKWHAMLNDLAEFTGMDAYELKGYIKGICGIKHSSEMEKMPFADLIERTYALGAELGYGWPRDSE